MYTAINAFNKLASSVAEMVNPLPATSMDLTQRQVIGLEEAERSLRVQNIDQAKIHKNNASQVSALFKDLRYPYLANMRSAGAKKMTSMAEERERERRITSKSESTLRKFNGERVSNMIRSLGWPFYGRGASSGPVYIVAEQSSMAEEEERLYRINNPFLAQTAKSNAAFAANAIRWGFPSRPLTSQNGTKKFTRAMQEKERTRQINDQEELFMHCQGAYNTAGLIRHLGWPFYQQTRSIPTSGHDIASVEDQERQRRLDNAEEQNIARSHANRISRLIPSSEIVLPAARDSPQLSREKPHMAHIEAAPQISLENSQEDFPRELEQDSFHEPEHTTYDIASICEQERARRLRDPQSQQNARQLAAKISALVDAEIPDWFRESFPIHPIEEERMSRMHDRALMKTQMKNARRVSRLVRDHNAQGPRRKSIYSHQMSAPLIIASPVLEDLPVSAAPAMQSRGLPASFVDSLPAAAENRGLPVMDNFLPMTPLVDQPHLSVPPLTPSIAAPSFLSRSADMIEPEPRTLTRTVSAEPLAAPGTPHGLANPFAHELHPQTSSAPVRQVAAATNQTAAPFEYTTPAAPLYFVPYSAQQVAPHSSHAIPHIPLVHKISTAPTYYSAAGSHELSDAQLKRLQRQAEKHNKAAAKEVRKANSSAAKAEKLHMRGKDSRASKIESKVQAHNIAAKNHQQWANELLSVKQHQQPSVLSSSMGLPSM